ncbi:Uncharacterized protein FKW44_005226, partial [Caligus rogercresseyi]
PHSPVTETPTDTTLMLTTTANTSFTCDGNPYGYYADVDNNCQIFHICLPIEDDLGQVIQTAQCNNSPSTPIASAHNNPYPDLQLPEDSFPCSEAPSLYGAVEFGRIPEKK